MKKITYSELERVFIDHNHKCNEEGRDFRKDYLVGRIVYKSENWPEKNYSLEARTYEFSSDNKCFCPWMGGYSLFAGSLDGSDPCVRIERVGWAIDYCYIVENEQD